MNRVETTASAAAAARRRRAAWLLLAGAWTAAPAAEPARLYRYYDANGVMHIESVLPPGQAQAGYEVLDRHTLRTLTVVPPAPTPQDLAEQAQRQRAAAAEQRRAQDRQNEAARQVYRDQMLLQTYASEAELIRLRDSKLASLAQVLRAVEQTIGYLRRNLEQMDATVAEHQAAGREPPPALRQARAKTAADLAEQERAAQRLRAEQAAIADGFAADLSRYRQLTGAANR